MTLRSLVVSSLIALLAHPASAADKPKRAKNVILFLADAGGIPSLNAASWLAYRAPQRLHVQSWPHVGLSDTSPASGFVTDSANGMSAIVTGVKTQNGVISEGPEAVRGKKDGHPTKTILEYAEEHGLSTGVVTNEPVTDATPAACYAHADDRGKWGEIFLQALTPRFGDGVDVLLGAGREPVEKQLVAMGKSLDGLAAQYQRPIYATLADATATRLRPIVVADEIDVRAATLRALDELHKSGKGFFLMVEWDAHTNDPKAGLEHIIAFDKLAKEVEARVNLDDTLLIFTADHSFGLRTRGEGNGGGILDGYDEWKASGVKDQPIRLKTIIVDNTHTGEEVAAMAIGAGSERVNGFFPNTQLFHVMLEAWGWKADGGGLAAPSKK